MIRADPSKKNAQNNKEYYFVKKEKDIREICTTKTYDLVIFQIKKEVCEIEAGNKKDGYYKTILNPKTGDILKEYKVMYLPTIVTAGII